MPRSIENISLMALCLTTPLQREFPEYMKRNRYQNRESGKREQARKKKIVYQMLIMANLSGKRMFLQLYANPLCSNINHIRRENGVSLLVLRFL